MKMQNAEMEFVAFDVQDVIATSGGGCTQAVDLLQCIGGGQKVYDFIWYEYDEDSNKWTSPGQQVQVRFDPEEIDPDWEAETYFHASNPFDLTTWIQCNLEHNIQ